MGEEMKAEKSKISPTSAALKVGEFWPRGMNRVCDSFYDKVAINFIALAYITVSECNCTSCVYQDIPQNNANQPNSGAQLHHWTNSPLKERHILRHPHNW